MKYEYKIIETIPLDSPKKETGKLSLTYVCVTIMQLNCKYSIGSSQFDQQNMKYTKLNYTYNSMNLNTRHLASAHFDAAESGKS